MEKGDGEKRAELLLYLTNMQAFEGEKIPLTLVNTISYHSLTLFHTVVSLVRIIIRSEATLDTQSGTFTTKNIF